MMLSHEKLNELVSFSEQDICTQVLKKHREAITVKSDKVAIKNLMKIFDATLDLSAKVGFHSMSVRDLSKHTGMSMGALYSYVESKERLLCMLLQFGSEFGLRHRQIADQLGSDPFERLLSSIQLFVFLAEQHQSWFCFIFMEAKFLNRKTLSRISEEEERHEQYYLHLLDAAHADGLVAEDNFQLLASTICSLVQDWYLKREKFRNQKITSEQYAQFICELVETKTHKKR